ncbi:uncharacterized protein LOC126458335 isoform X2 [Schistocerca serialis cubense]|uniref:uncharacterized protein LOC126458335 isoform X2 n=1 Tax=Schistocerca serialis cubense TaxID=2023355 RepID=UPI00214E17D0|nr:uncharacterized protein LOC126458335 isoform X2 [Schistocerca serialis cubense]
MLPLSPESPLDARETMDSVPEAMNLVKSGRNGAGSPANDTLRGSTAVEGNGELSVTVVTRSREDVQVTEGFKQSSITHVAVTATSTNGQTNRQGIKRYLFREPPQLQPQSGAERRVSQGEIVGTEDQVSQKTAADGGKLRAMENGRWMEMSAARPDGTDVRVSATNMTRDTNSDDEYIDVETFDPVEDRRQWLLEQSRRLVASNRVQYEDITPHPEIPSSAEQISRDTTEAGGEHTAIDDDRVPSLDSGCYSDEEVRVRMRVSSSDWSDSVGEAHRNKESGTGKLSSSSVTPEDADKSHRHSYRGVYSVNDDKMAFSPPEPTSSSDRPAPNHELRQVATLKHNGNSTIHSPIHVPYVKSCGGYTLYIPGKVLPPEKDISVSSNGNVRVSDTLSGPVSRNSTEVVYTMDTSAVRMSTSTSSAIDSHVLLDNVKYAAAVVQRKSVVVSTGDDSTPQRELNRCTPEEARGHDEILRTKSVDRANVQLLPNNRDEAPNRYLQQFSSYNPNRAVIIPIPSEKSAFVNTSHSSVHSGLKAVVAPGRYLRVEGSVSETRNSRDRNAVDFEKMAPPLETVHRYIPSGTFIPRGYITPPPRMVVKNPVSSRADFNAAVIGGTTHPNGVNSSNARRRSDARMTPDNSRDSEYAYHHSKPIRVVYTPISDIADDEPPRKVSRFSYGNERLLSIAEIEHESQTAVRHARYLTTEAMTVGAQSRDAELRSINHWPVAYGSHILKTYLRGQDALGQESVHRSNSPASRDAVPDSETSSVRQWRMRFGDRLRAEEEFNPVDRKERISRPEIESVTYEGSCRKPLNDYNSKGDVNGTLDLSKKDLVQQRDGAVSAKEAVHFERGESRYVSSDERCSPTERNPKSHRDPVVTPASVIVTSGAGGSGKGVHSGGEHSRQVVRTVIVSADSRKVGSGQKSSPLQPEVETERFREVRSEGRTAEPSTVLAPEPGGQRSRYMITREGDGNRFVIREVGSDVRTAAGQLIAIKERIESELGGSPTGAVQGRRVLKDVNRGEVGAVRSSKSPPDDRHRPPASVIRTAPRAPSRESRPEQQRPTEGDLSDDEVVELYRVRRVLPGGMPHFEPTAGECAWADAEWASGGGRVEDESVYGPSDSDEDRALRLRVSVILWALLGGERLRAVGWPRQAARRVLWRTVDVCCAVAGAKSPAAVPLPADHDCGADMACFRDHAHRFLEVCAPTRDHWKRYGWASLTIDAVVAKVYREDIAPWLRTLPDEVVPAAVRSCVRQLQAMRATDSPPQATPPPALPTPPRDATPAASATPTAAGQLQSPTLGLSPAVAAASEATQDARKKRGRPAKPASKADAGRVERVMLWRFLLNLLEDPRNEPCIHWVNRDQGIFRILNTDWLARLWGRRHGNPRMTYEKMARAMRTYYRSKVLQPVPRSPNLPRKLVYKFNPAVVQRVAAANKLAQQQQQQQQHHQQRLRQPKHALQYEADQARKMGPDPQTPPQPQAKDRSQQVMLLGHQQLRQLPQHEHYYLSQRGQHHKLQLHQAGDFLKPLENGRHWEPHHHEQVLHQPEDHRLSPEDGNKELLQLRLHQYHQHQLQLYQMRHLNDEQKPLLREVHNTVHKETHQLPHHHQQWTHQIHKNTDQHSPQSHGDSQHLEDHKQDHQQHLRASEGNSHHQPARSLSDDQHSHSPKELHNLQVMQRVSASPDDRLNPTIKDNLRQKGEQLQLEQARTQREDSRSSPAEHDLNDIQRQQVPNERESSSPDVQQT